MRSLSGVLDLFGRDGSHGALPLGDPCRPARGGHSGGHHQFVPHATVRECPRPAAKTDDIDAAVFAEFAAVMKPVPTEPPSETIPRITGLIVA